jgi:glycosyltransferase involved in cell wall biosynthesis
MKVLIITHKPPFPAIDGGCVATAQIVEMLEENQMDYRLALIHTPKHPLVLDAFPRAIRKKIVCSELINTTSIWRFLLSVFDWRNAVFLQRFYSKNFEQKLLNFCETYKPDVIHFESLFATVYYEALRKRNPVQKFVLRSHNLEHELWRQRAKSSLFLHRLFLHLPIEKLRKWEDYIFKQMDGIAAIALDEIEFGKRIAPGAPSIYLPSGVAVTEESSTCEPVFFHIAAMDWSPNKRALHWFLEKVWKESNFADTTKLHLAGKGLKKADYITFGGIKNHGMVADSRDFMLHHGIMIVPLFEGSGLRIKIIEAGALGTPIIATKKAVEGLHLEQGEHILLAETANEFRAAMQLLLEDVSLRKKIGLGIKKYMNDNFNQELLKEKLVEFYRSI